MLWVLPWNAFRAAGSFQPPAGQSRGQSRGDANREPKAPFSSRDAHLPRHKPPCAFTLQLPAGRGLLGPRHLGGL